MWGAFDGTGLTRTITVTDSQGNTYTTVKSQNVAVDGDTIAVGCAIAGSSAADTLTFKDAGSATAMNGVIYEVSGKTCTADVTPVSSNPSSGTSCGAGTLTVTTSTANDFLFEFCGTIHVTQTFTATNSFINLLGDNTPGSAIAAGMTETAASPGTFTVGGTYTATGENATIIVPYK